MVINFQGSAFTRTVPQEKLGTALSDVAVKREWAPRLFQGERLKRCNSLMSQIDLISETLGPFIAGPLDRRWRLDLGFLRWLTIPNYQPNPKSICSARVLGCCALGTRRICQDSRHMQLTFLNLKKGLHLPEACGN